LTWETLWAVGRYDLRLTDEEFWHMVPRQFVALMERRRDWILRQEFSAGVVAAALFNSRGVKIAPQKFMPSWKEPRRRETPWQEMRAKMLQAAGTIGGVQ
jgi:hypothetical protein